MRRALRAVYLAVCLGFIGALAAELALVLQSRSRVENAARHSNANIFESARLITEVGRRGLWLRPGESYRPGATLVTQVAGERYQVRINRRGYRTKEFSERKPAGLRRVVCIGGSTTVQGRTNDETYPALLERLLEHRWPHQQVEVLNLGISGTDTIHWLERRDELFRYQPDVVVQYEFVNDFFWDYLPRYAAEHPWRVTARRSLLLSSAYPPRPEEFASAFLRTLRRFSLMNVEGAEHGAAYVVGSFAGPDASRAPQDFGAYLDINVAAWGGRYGVRHYAEYRRILDGYNRHFAAFARDRGLLTAPVGETLRDSDLFVDLCHMTPRGIEALAEAFLPAVLVALDRSPTESGSTGR